MRSLARDLTCGSADGTLGWKGEVKGGTHEGLPVDHAHVLEQAQRRLEPHLRSLWLTGLPIEPAKPQPTVCFERVHPQLGGASQCVLIVPLGSYGS